ncbi:MAG: phosphoglycerate dehydrogenase [Planctomycetota bacterium]|nr:MAG: phosphoglycerate dehydrogenase [Planctomycetota bacterium]
MPRVYISDKLEEAGMEILRAAGLEIDNRPGLKGEDLKEAIRAADGVVVRSGTRITPELLEDPGALKAVVRGGVGVDNIDVAAATRKGIVVMNTPDANTLSTAEHTISLLMALARHIPAADASMRSGKWEKNRFLGAQLTGKTLGVIGLGRIGREVARRAAQGLGMRVIGFDPVLAPSASAQLGIQTAPSVDELCPQCDFITVHTPLTTETRHMVGARQLALLPAGARVINCARGGIIDEKALLESLDSGHLAGAALDVFETEPLPADHPIVSHPKMVITPHLGAATLEAQVLVARESAQLLVDFLCKGQVRFAVNMAALDRAEMEEVRPYVDLARRLGILFAQMVRGSITRAEIRYRGDVADKPTRLITGSFAAGLLENYLEQHVNLVNARVLAQERGITIVEEQSSEKGDFSSLIEVVVQTDKKEYRASGTLFGNRHLRLVQLGAYRLDAHLDGTLLLFTHRDVPGLIGFIGNLFGQQNINIAHMTVGRQEKGGEAIAVMNLDGQPPAEAIEQVANHPQVGSVSLVNLPPMGIMPGWFA